MNIQKLQSLEQDPAVIAGHIGNAAFGKSKIIYLPLLIGMSVTVFLLFILFDGLTAAVGTQTMILLAVSAAMLYFATYLIYQKDLKTLKASTTSATTAIGKKIAGNDDIEVYFCIYTAGEHRHSEAFIENVATRIFSLPNNAGSSVEQKVAKMFRPDEVKPGEFGAILPLEFTDGIPVYRKQFAFKHYTPAVKAEMGNDNDLFAVVAIRAENGRFLKQYYQ